MYVVYAHFLPCTHIFVREGIAEADMRHIRAKACV
jgi:hypothetical protein